MPDRPFKRRSDLELDRLSDEQVVEYLVAARAAGDQEAVRMAMQILVYGRMDYVESYVANRVPEHAVQRVAQKAMIDAMKAVFDGESVGQFVNLLKTVTARRCADYYKKGEFREESTLDADDERRRRREVEDPENEVEAVEVRVIADEIIAGLPEQHRAVVDLAVYEDRPSAEVSEEVNRRFPQLDEPMTPANVDQIKSRFRRALREALEAGDTEP